MKVQVKRSKNKRQSTKKILTFARLEGGFILCFLTFLYFTNYFVVKRTVSSPTRTSLMTCFVQMDNFLLETQTETDSESDTDSTYITQMFSFSCCLIVTLLPQYCNEFKLSLYLYFFIWGDKTTRYRFEIDILK